MVKDVEDAIRDRLRDTFLFAFAAAAAELNWKFLYVLARSHRAPIESFEEAAPYVADGWVWKALGLALLFSFGFPLLKIVFQSFRALVDVWQENIVTWIRRRKLYDLETIQSNPQFLTAIQQRDALATKVCELHRQWAGLGGSFTMLRMARPETGFAFRIAGDHVAKVSGAVDEKKVDSLLYVVECIPGTELVVCSEAGVAFRPLANEVPWLVLNRDGTITVWAGDPIGNPDARAWLCSTGEGLFRMRRRAQGGAVVG